MIKSDSSRDESLAAFFVSLKEQQKTIQKLTEHYANNAEAAGSFKYALQLLADVDLVIVTGMGKSGKIGDKIAATLSSTGSPAVFVHPGEASHGDLGIVSIFKKKLKVDRDLKTVIVAISNSGETKELADMVNYANKHSVPLISITKNNENTLAEHATVSLVTAVETEESCPIKKAPMNSTTATLVLGDAIAAELMNLHGFTADDFKDTHPGGSLGDALAVVSSWMAKGDKMPVVVETDTMNQVYDALDSKNLGCVVVVDAENSQAKGIITDGMLRKIQRKREVMDFDAPATQYMHENPHTIHKNFKVEEALDYLNENNINHLPIVNDDDQVEGVFTFHTRP